MSAVEDIRTAAEKVKAEGKSKPRVARHPVNQPMVDHWLDAMGDRNPIYVDDEAAKAAGHPGIVAPPAMIQVWTMMGLGGVRAPDDPLTKILDLFDDAGFIGVVATNCEQTYHRYLRPDEEVSVSAELTDVVGPKQTALGEGFFITQKITWQVGDEDVAEMMWRIMKFRPADQDGSLPPSAVPDDLDADMMMRPSSSRDTKFFWDGVNAHELRIQKGADGSLQHPPVPALWQDKEVPTDYVVASGKGTVFSFVVHHAPKVPGRTLPFVIALVELEEGARMLGELRDVDPATVEIGMPVRATYIDFPANDVGSGLDAVRMGARRMSAPTVEVGTKLPELKLYGDPTFIVSTAIATRDYQDVHHDRDKAQAKGSKDIFVNILTDTGLVQRYITDWAGPDAIIKSIGLRLGVPWYAYDTVTFKGEVTAIEDGLITLKIVGSNSLGDHVIATATLTVGGA